MREIKFRGKSLETGEWIFGDLIENQGRFFIYKASSETTFKDDDDGQIVLVAKEVDQKTVGEYTGLHDAEGKEIYEGDIFQVKAYEPKYEVCFNKAGFEYRQIGGTNKYFPLKRIYSDTYILGNRWDNPELQKGDQDGQTAE